MSESTHAWKTKTVEALAHELRQSRLHLRGLLSQAATHQLTQVREIRKARKQVARLQTFLHERQIFSV